MKSTLLQTEGFDGFTLELWSQLGGNKRKYVWMLKHSFHHFDELSKGLSSFM